MKLLLIIFLVSQAAFAQECEDSTTLGKFTSWISSFLPKAPVHQCPDHALGRVAHDQSLGGKYLKEIANIGFFDKALQRDAHVKSFLQNDPRLKSSKAKDKDLAACVSQGPTFKYLLGLDSGVKEKYDIGEHTSTVLNTYLQQKKFYSGIDLKNVTTKTMDQLMLPILALHDIGKGIAVKARDKELQHFYTTKFVRTYLKSAKFTDKEINLAVALIDHDSVGEYLRPDGITAAKSRRQLHERAKIAGMSYPNFMKLQQLFYTSDAASYPFLKKRVFNVDGRGKLDIKNPKFKELLK